MHHLRSIRRLVLGAALAGAAIGAVPALAGAASTCSYDPALKRATVVDGSGSDPLRVVRNGVFITVADGNATAKPCSGGFFKYATIDNTDDISVTRGPASGADMVTLDESAGVFGPGATQESTGISEIETTVSSDSPFDLTLIGTEEHDVIAVSAAVNVNLNDDSDIDVSVTGGTRTVAVNGRGGGDTITGKGTAAPGVLGTRSTRVPLFLNGDAGDDLLIGGLGTDRFNGGEGDDILRSAADNASDVLFGESGFDIADHDASDVFGDAVEIRHVLP